MGYVNIIVINLSMCFMNVSNCSHVSNELHYIVPNLAKAFVAQPRTDCLVITASRVTGLSVSNCTHVSNALHLYCT